MDITEVLNELHIPFITSGHEHARDGWIQLDCPHCTPNSRHWRLGYNLQYGYMNCWACGPQNVLAILEESSGESRGRCLSLLRQVKVLRTHKRESRKRKLTLPDALGPLQPAHERYLKKRGFDPDQLEQLWGLKGIGIAAKLQWRIFIPVLHKGEIVSWTTRSISDAGVRYLSCPDEDELIPHKKLLYGADYARHTVIAVEGPTDVWRIGPGCVGLFGTSFTRSQVHHLSLYPVRYICFDAERSARGSAERLAEQLSSLPGKTFVIELDRGDPDGLSASDLRTIRRLLK